MVIHQIVALLLKNTCGSKEKIGNFAAILRL